MTRNALGEPLTRSTGASRTTSRAATTSGSLTLLLAVIGAVGGDRRWARASAAARHARRPDSRVSTLLFADAGGAVAAVRVRHAALCDPVLRAARLQPAALGVSMGVPLHPAMAALAGFGLDWLLSRPGRGAAARRDALGWVAAVAGAAGAAASSLLSVLVARAVHRAGRRMLNWGFWSDLAKTQGLRTARCSGATRRRRSRGSG